MELDRYIELILTGEATVSADTLVQLLHAAADAYTNVGVDIEVPVVDAETLEIIGSKTIFAEPFITDEQFNQLELLLKATDPGNHYFLEVGSEVRGGKVELPFRMGSLDQLYAGDAEKWIRSNGWLDVDFVLSDKYDGTSGSIIWDHKGALKVSHSRGNGIMGADITRHVRRMPAVPQRVSQPIATRNEFIMRKTRFTDVQGQISSRSGRTYKNARNFVAGKMNASESEDIFYDNISVVVTSVVEPKMGKSAGFELCRSLGMEVADYVVVKGRDINDAMLSAYLDERRSKSSYELDGIVIDVDDADIRAQMRKLDPSKLNPAYSAKYKTASADNNAVTEVVAVHWRVSKAGYLKPRVEIQPVDLMGVTITYATGFNAAFIRDGGIGPGAKIQITRAGDVIPYITRVIEPAAAGASMPTAGQFGVMEYTEGDVDLYVLDVENNAEATLYRIIDAFKTLDVPFLRQGSVEKLVEAGFDSEAKIIRASLAELQAAVGQSAGEKIHEGLKLRLNPVDMATLMGASQTLGRGMGVRKSTRLLAGLGGSLDNLPASPVEAAKLIASIEGFEKKTATSVVNNLPRLHKFLASIEGFYTVAAPKAKVVGGDLADVTVVFTGVRDKDLEAKIAARGGTIGSSVNKNTTHLVCKDPTANSSKLQKARELLAAENILDLPAARALWGA